MQFTDGAIIGGTRKTADGYLVADCRTVRAGVQDYLGSEVGRPELAVVRVYRPASEVFAKDSLRSFSHVPLTVDHPTVAVDATNWRELAVGETSGEVLRDGESLRIPLIVKDAAAIAAIEGGKRQLSAGYTCDIEFVAGRTDGGHEYDAIQRTIRANHVAIVAAGRAGPEHRIGDAAAPWGIAPITTDEQHKERTMTLKTVTVDGIPVEVTDQGATVIATLQARLADAGQKLAAADVAHAAVVKAKDEEIGTLKADNAKLKDAAPKPGDLDRMVADRVALVTAARAIVADLKPDGLTEADIRKAAVKAKLGDEIIKDASDDMIAGMFKALAKDVKAPDPVRDALLGRDTATADKGVGDAYAQMVKDMQSAHRPAATN